MAAMSPAVVASSTAIPSAGWHPRSVSGSWTAASEGADHSREATPEVDLAWSAAHRSSTFERHQLERVTSDAGASVQVVAH